VLTRAKVVIQLYGGTEHVIAVRWFKPGLGGLRPVGKCPHCQRSAFRLYRIYNRLHCKKCCNGIYASQARNSDTRGYIRAMRLRNFVGNFSSVRARFPERPAHMRSRTYNRLRAQCLALEERLPRRPWRSKRISERTLRPRQRYRSWSVTNMG
jgi:hypothetical protein